MHFQNNGRWNSLPTRTTRPTRRRNTIELKWEYDRIGALMVLFWLELNFVCPGIVFSVLPKWAPSSRSLSFMNFQNLHKKCLRFRRFYYFWKGKHEAVHCLNNYQLPRISLRVTKSKVMQAKTMIRQSSTESTWLACDWVGWGGSTIKWIKTRLITVARELTHGKDHNYVHNTFIEPQANHATRINFMCFTMGNVKIPFCWIFLRWSMTPPWIALFVSTHWLLNR